MVNTKIFAAAGLAATATAQYTKPEGFTPCGVTCNPIQKPETGSTIDAGKAFEIKWQPSTEGTVTIYVCEGLSNNCQNQAAPIADHIGNTGSFTWVPPSTLKPSAGQGYGLQIIQDSKPSIFQWSGQFGVANSGYTGGASSSAASSAASVSKAASGSAYPTGTGIASTPPIVTSIKHNGTSATPTTWFSATGTGSVNSTVLTPTIPMTVPTTLQTGGSAPTTAGSGSGSQTTSARPSTPTGAAGHVQAGMGLLVGGIVAALAL